MPTPARLSSVQLTPPLAPVNSARKPHAEQPAADHICASAAPLGPSFLCPIQYVVELLGNKWSILIFRELFLAKRRTNELLTALPGISTKTLTQRLREMEQHGLVQRQIYPEIPPHVEYSLTEKGYQLQPVMTALHQVGLQWLAQENCICPLTDLPAEER